MIALVLLFLCIFCILFVAQTRGTLYFKEKLNIASGSRFAALLGAPKYLILNTYTTFKN